MRQQALAEGVQLFMGRKENDSDCTSLTKLLQGQARRAGACRRTAQGVGRAPASPVISIAMARSHTLSFMVTRAA